MKQQFKTFLAEKARAGVRTAIWTIREKITHGYNTTTIVLPPRAGKAYVMRGAAVEFMETGLVGAVICLVPWLFLAEQLNDHDKIELMRQHHGMDEAEIQPVKLGFDVLSGSIDPKFFRHTPLRHWWTMTMGQAQQEATRLILESAATYLKHAEGKPLLVFIDECHLTSSGPDGWGKIAKTLQEAGAHLVLLTGTPDRSDNIAPYGFRVEELSRDEYKGNITSRTEDGNLKIDRIIADRVRYKVVADFTVKLQEAWMEEIITKVQYTRFNCDSDGKPLSEMSESESQRTLTRVLREPEVVAEAVGAMLNELQTRRRTHLDIAAIVFVGSDREDDEEKDFECRQVKRIIEKQWRNHFNGKPDVKIATMADDKGVKARNTIKRFVGGVGDVLIVKQMGGVGLDAPRIKVALDLSTIRTKSNTTQRWLRVTTKYGNIQSGTLILPSDPRTARLYREIVEEQGGQFCLENVSLVETKLVEPIDGQDAPVEWNITNPRRDGSVDMTQEEINAEEDLLVDAMFAQLPALAIAFSRVQIAKLIRAGTLHPAPVDQIPAPAAKNPVKTKLFDGATEVKKKQSEIYKLCRDLTTHVVGPYSNDEEKWRITNSRFLNRAKTHAGIPGKTSQCRDIQQLEKALQFLEQQQRSHETI